MGGTTTITNQGNWPGIETDQQNVSTAGTAEALNGGTSLSIPDGASLAITALPDNTDNIYVGDDSVSATTGDVLTAGASIELNVGDVSTVHIDADTAGDGVSWIVEVDE